MLLRETLGLSADGSTKAYRNDDVDSFYAREPDPLTLCPYRPTDHVNHIFTAVDPSGGGASAFSVATIIVTARGAFQVARPDTCLFRTTSCASRKHASPGRRDVEPGFAKTKESKEEEFYTPNRLPVFCLFSQNVHGRLALDTKRTG